MYKQVHVTLNPMLFRLKAIGRWTNIWMDMSYPAWGSSPRYLSLGVTRTDLCLSASCGSSPSFPPLSPLSPDTDPYPELIAKIQQKSQTSRMEPKRERSKSRKNIPARSPTLLSKVPRLTRKMTLKSIARVFWKDLIPNLRERERERGWDGPDRTGGKRKKFQIRLFPVSFVRLSARIIVSIEISHKHS